MSSRTHLCPHGCGHRVRAGHQHKRANCPPPQGKRGDRYHSLHTKREAAMPVLTFDSRGAAVAGVGGSKAKTHRRGTAKSLKA